jgi:hypothetical protein
MNIKTLETRHAELAAAIRSTPIEETDKRCKLLDEYWTIDANIKLVYRTGNYWLDDDTVQLPLTTAAQKARVKKAPKNQLTKSDTYPK